MLELYDEKHLRTINVNRDEEETVRREGDSLVWELYKNNIF